MRGLGTLEEQLDACERLLDLEPNHPAAAIRKKLIMGQLAREAVLKGKSAMDIGEYETAESLLLNAVRYDPEIQVKESSLISQAKENANREREARERESQRLREEARKLQMEKDRPLLERQVRGQGTLEEQLEACRRLLSFEPNHPVAATRKEQVMELMADEAIQMGRMATESGDYESAESQFHLARQLSPKREKQMSSFILQVNELKEKRRRAWEIEEKERADKEIESRRDWLRLWQDG